MSEIEQERLRFFLEDVIIDDLGISENSSGFGMGLYISNFIAKQLSADKSSGIQFKSQLNMGSEFCF